MCFQCGWVFDLVSSIVLPREYEQPEEACTCFLHHISQSRIPFLSWMKHLCSYWSSVSLQGHGPHLLLHHQGHQSSLFSWIVSFLVDFPTDTLIMLCCILPKTKFLLNTRDPWTTDQILCSSLWLNSSKGLSLLISTSVSHLFSWTHYN